MARYFTHIDDGHETQTDDHGTEFQSSQIAISEAVRMAGEIVRDSVRDELADARVGIRVTDDQSREVASIDLELTVIKTNIC